MLTGALFPARTAQQALFQPRGQPHPPPNFTWQSHEHQQHSHAHLQQPCSYTPQQGNILIAAGYQFNKELRDALQQLSYSSPRCNADVASCVLRLLTYVCALRPLCSIKLRNVQ